LNFTLINSNELPINTEIEIQWPHQDYPYFDSHTLTLECPGQWYCGFETSGISAESEAQPQLVFSDGIYEPTFPLIPAETGLNLIVGPVMFPLQSDVLTFNVKTVSVDEENQRWTIDESYDGQF